MLTDLELPKVMTPHATLTEDFPVPVVTSEIDKGATISSDGDSKPSRRLNVPALEPHHHVGACTRLRSMLANSDQLIVCPGVYDGLSARIALDVGFDALYMVGHWILRPKCFLLINAPLADRRRYHSIATRAGRPRHRPASRYASAR